MAKQSKRLPQNYVPSSAEVNKYFRQWNTMPDNVTTETALIPFFRDKAGNPTKNTDPVLVLTKVTLLNNWYATGILNPYEMYHHIMGMKNLDTRLLMGDCSLIDDIRNIQIRNKKFDFYSFATKFCCLHCPDKFPIYDSFVEKVILDLDKKYPNIFTFKYKYQLRDYGIFKDQIDILNTYWKLNLPYRDLDRYLWLLGKQYF